MNPEISELLQLRNSINRHNHLYYVKNQPEISDFAFDELMRRLSFLEKKYPETFDPHSPTQRVGSDLIEGFKSYEHKYPMLSLTNVYNNEELIEFDAFIRREYPNPQYVCELKFDGLSISLTYINGKLSRALTRGDGERGDDVTENIRTIRSIPLSLTGNDFPALFEMRGEVFMPRNVFDALNKEKEHRNERPFANPRNAAAGSLKLLSPTQVAKRHLDAYLYYMLGENLPTDSHTQNLERAKSWGFKVSEYSKQCANVDEIISFINQINELRPGLPFDIDGIVIKLDSLEQQKRFGLRAKSPRWATAYKYPPEQKPTKLLSVEFQVGRTGVITPVANFEPIPLSGSIVQRATLHNKTVMDNLDLHQGDTIIVEKAGEIIPKVLRVDVSKRTENAQKIIFPTHCPICGTALLKEEDNASHFCPNDTGCLPQQIAKLSHFVGRNAMNITGLGEEKLQLLLDRNLIHKPSDLYKLTPEMLLGLQSQLSDTKASYSLQEKSVANLLQAINLSRSQAFHKLLFALGIRFVGQSVAKRLAKSLKTIDALQTASREQLLAIPDVGERIADSIISFFQLPDNQQEIINLRNAGLQMQYDGPEETETTNKPLAGLKICISGTFSIKRDDMKNLIELNGGENVSSISQKTDFLLAGDKIGPEKLKKAQKLSIQILSETDFLEYIKNK